MRSEVAINRGGLSLFWGMMVLIQLVLLLSEYSSAAFHIQYDFSSSRVSSTRYVYPGHCGFVSLLLAKRNNDGPESSFPQEEEECDEETDQLSNSAWLREHFQLTEDWQQRKIDSTIPQINSMDHSKMIDRLGWMKKRLKLTKAEQTKIIRRHPRVLLYVPETNLQPTMLFLEEKLALKTKALSRLIQDEPTILNLGIGENQTLQRNLHWMETTLNLTEPKELGKVASRAPQILYLSVENNLDPKIKMLQKRFNFDDAEVATIITKAPIMISRLSLENLESKLNWFRDRLRMDKIQLGKAIKRHPRILLSSVEGTFEPKLTWLQERLCLDFETVRLMILQQPAILLYSTTNKMDPVLQWLVEVLRVEEPHGLAALIKKQTRLFDYNIQSNLEPTMNFYKMCIGDEQAVEMVTGCPTFLGYSLEGRLQPRLEQLKELGVEVNKTWVTRIALLTEKKWEEAIQKI